MTECNTGTMSFSSDKEEAAPSEGLRERKKRERGQALRRAAIDLALEKGYHNVTVEDICERCGVSRRTFFNYYSSKEEALLGRADTVFDEEDQPAIEEFEAGGPHGRLVADLEYLLSFIVATRMSNAKRCTSTISRSNRTPRCCSCRWRGWATTNVSSDGSSNVASTAGPASPRRSESDRHRRNLLSVRRIRGPGRSR